MADDLEDMLICQICMEDYEETGDHVPRILPCHHSLCEKCLRRIIKINFMECPECRTIHRVSNQVKTFPQNKYILTNIRRKHAGQGKTTIKACEEHKKELILYCKGPECLRAICPTCLTKYHRGEGHDVVDTGEIRKEKKDSLLAKIEVITRSLQEKKKTVLKAKEEAEGKNKECIKKITAGIEQLVQITRRCDQLIAVVDKQIRQNVATEKLAFINEHSGLLGNIRGEINKEVITEEEIEANMDKVNSVERSIKDHLSGILEFKEFKIERKESSLDAEGFCGHL